MPVALITGAARGIGLGAATALAQAGFDIAAIGIEAPDEAAGALAELGRSGCRAIYIRADIADLAGQLMPYLHLPVQSGSDRMLKAMNRRHRAADYQALVERLRRARPDLALSGDFIVGFPGESDADFSATLRLVEAVGYASAFTFKYSPRPGTPAAEIAARVPEAVKSARLLELQALVAAQQTTFNAAMLGRDTTVLLERSGRRPGQLVGRSPWLQAVHVDAPPALIGQIVPVTIDGIGSNSLFGALSGAHNDADGGVPQAQRGRAGERVLA